MSQYRTGRVSVETNSTLVAGTGTFWLGEVDRGDFFLLADDTTGYYVDTVVSDTVLHLSAPFRSAARADWGYAVARDFTPNRGYPVALPGDIEAIRELTRAIQMIDADIPVGGAGARRLDDLLDVDAGDATAGWVLTRRGDGLFAPLPPAPGGGTVANAGGTGAALVAGTGAVRRLRGENLDLVENTDHVLLRAPPPGEANTAANIGGVGSVGIIAGKVGTVIQAKGLRAGANVSIVPEGNDLVIAAAGGAGGSVTVTNDGTGVVKVFRAQSGNAINLRSMTFDAARFATTLSGDGTTYTVGLRVPGLGELADVDAAGSQPGHLLQRQADNRWRSVPAPAPGIAALAADPDPTLGGNLSVGARRIVGLDGVIPGLIATPRAKAYVLVLALPAPIVLASLRATTAAGDCQVSLAAGGITVGSDQVGSGGVAVTAAPGGAEAVFPAAAAGLGAGTELALSVGLVSPDCADLAFAIYYKTA